MSTPPGSTTELPPGDLPPGAQPPPDPDGGPRVDREQMRDLGRLRRSDDDRYVAGVAGGLARHLDIDPLVVRVALVVLAFFGGSGIALYLALWLLVPSEGRRDAALPLDARSRSVALVGALALAVLLVLGDAFNGWVAWPLAVVALLVAAVMSQGRRRGGREPQEAPQRRGPLLFWFTLACASLAVGVIGVIDLAGVDMPLAAYPAAALAVVGAMLVVGAFHGRAGGLILVGLLLAVATGGAHLGDSVQRVDRTVVPAAASQVPERYSFGVGDSLLDLSTLGDAAGLAGREVVVEQGAGRLELRVPRGVDVDVRARVGAGSVEVLGRTSGGIAIDLSNGYSATSDDPPPGALRLEVSLGLGELVVSRP